MEEVPDRLWPQPPLIAPELFGERAQAAQRHTERVARVGARTVEREGSEATEIDFSRLDEGELFQHFDDARTMAGEARGTTARASLDAASRAMNQHGRVPTAAQVEAILALESRAPTDVGIFWDSMRGSPRTLGGVFHVRRGAPGVEVAREWLETSWPELSVALGADASDTVEYVGQSALPSRDVEVVWFRRVRAEHPMRENYIEVHVTTDRHPVGPSNTKSAPSDARIPRTSTP